MRHPPGHAICGCHWWSSINRRYREFPLQSLPHRQCLFHSCQSLNAESRIQPRAFGSFASLLKIVDGNMLDTICSCTVLLLCPMSNVLSLCKFLATFPGFKSWLMLKTSVTGMSVFQALR